MSGALILALTALRLGTLQHNYTGNDIYYEFPHFWKSTGFCPAGEINHEGITTTLLSNPVRMQLLHIAGLPTGAVTHVRIHWLLELIQFVQYTQSGIPIYNFGDLDAFLTYLDEDLNLKPVIEFMANPGNVFVSNPNRNDYLWADFAFQVTRHYLNYFGGKKVLEWRFETWNEPDLRSYNRLNFTVDDYLTYITAVSYGLKAAGRRPSKSLNFQLRGPAGLFKSEENHPFCWNALEYCNSNISNCPFDILSFHRKGNGMDSSILIEETSTLLQKIYAKYPALKALPISNDEADPIAGWSTPRDFQADVRYAMTLVSTVVSHWVASINRSDFKNLESISHDNAFLSFHPYEFSQRTLLAHFQMNETDPPHSQFIQKPVYAALGLLSKLASQAAMPELNMISKEEKFWMLKTTVVNTEPLFISWLLFSKKAEEQKNSNFTFEFNLPFKICEEESYAYILEFLEQKITDPYHIWKYHESPPYPNATLRELMRRNQTPRLHSTSPILSSTFRIVNEKLNSPWIALLRFCSILVDKLQQPQTLVIESVTHNEVFLSWRETINSVQCLKSYEVWFRLNETYEWISISQGWHLPFPSFQFAPSIGTVNGFYKVRGVDIFDRYSTFSDEVEFIEV